MSNMENVESRKLWAVIINCILLISRCHRSDIYLQWAGRKWHLWVVEKKCMTHQHPMTALRISYFYQWKYNEISMENICDYHCSYVCVVMKQWKKYNKTYDYHALLPSLILIGTGASLMGFYRLQMLEVFCLILLEVVDFYFTFFCSRCSIFILPYFAWNVWSLFCPFFK